jgi:hypothetical protein
MIESLRMLLKNFRKNRFAGRVEVTIQSGGLRRIQLYERRK